MKEQEVQWDQIDEIFTWHEKVCQRMQEGQLIRQLLVSIQDPFHLLLVQVFSFYILFFVYYDFFSVCYKSLFQYCIKAIFSSVGYSV